jgi:hypothetical protein
MADGFACSAKSTYRGIALNVFFTICVFCSILVNLMGSALVSGWSLCPHPEQDRRQICFHVNGELLFRNTEGKFMRNYF